MIYSMKTTPKMKDALVKIRKGEKVPTPMLRRLASRSLVKLRYTDRLSGAGGYASIHRVVTGAVLTAKGYAESAGTP
jgi:hypothetical protein